MSLVKRNIIANLVGSGWVALISIAFIPLYIHFMGVEAYALVGFYLTLQALFALLDMGMTATVSRELARLSSSNEQIQQMRDLVRTLELIYWAIAAMITVMVLLLAPWIASQWLNANSLSEGVIQQAVILMGFMIAFRMPYGFYSGGLLGLQRQVLLNIVKVAVETLKSVGVVLVLWLFSPDITTFFLWQLIVSVLGVVLMTWCLWHNLPAGKPASFKPSIFRKVWRFAAGMSIISSLALVLTQSDKLILSKMLSLELFGYYVLASTVSMGLYVIISPIFSAIYPRFTMFVSSGDDLALKKLYHKSCQLMTVLVMPVALVVSFFSENILLLWTQNELVSSHAGTILSLLILGTALNGMMNIPYALQLAYGWTRFAIYANLIAIFILIPALIVAVSNYGATGGAMIWLLLNIGYIVVGLFFMHQRLLKGELKHWFMHDFGVPTAFSATVVMISWWFKPEVLMHWQFILWVFSTAVFSFLAAIITAPVIRQEAWSWCRHASQ